MYDRFSSRDMAKLRIGLVALLVPIVSINGE
jgi:hypothetical protein